MLAYGRLFHYIILMPTGNWLDPVVECFPVYYYTGPISRNGTVLYTNLKENQLIEYSKLSTAYINIRAIITRYGRVTCR